MKSNLKISALGCITLVIVASLTGCTDAGSVLAEESAKFAICTLDQGQSCQVTAPAGTRVEKATLASPEDAIRVFGTVSSTAECEGFAAHAKSRSPKHITQAIINNVVVMPYGEVLPHNPSVKSACAASPYNVSLIVAKAP